MIGDTVEDASPEGAKGIVGVMPLDTDCGNAGEGD
jgi:hypothetical protein